METSPSAPMSPETRSYRPRHTTAQRAVLALNVVVVIACLVGAVALLYGKDQLDGRLQTAKVDVRTTAQPTAGSNPADGPTSSTSPPETFPAADPTAENFLITGSDAHACATPGSPWAGATYGREGLGSRSDTIMVMRVDPVTRAAAVLSFPRDLWVKIPGHSKNRINSAYVQNDYSLLAQTLYDNFGIKINHYVQVDFCAFKRIVDGVGGVSVPFNTPVVDARVGLDIKPKAGETAPYCHTFSGDEALAYVRSRHLKSVDAQGNKHEDTGADLGRISRQQDFLRRVLQTALDKGLFDPKVARSLIDTLQNDIVTESGFTIDDMLKFAGVLHDVDPAGIHTYQAESKGQMIGENAVQVYVDSKDMRAILAIFQGTAPLVGAPDQTVASSTTVAPTGAATTAPSPGSTGPVVTQPADNSIGQILPPKDVVCS